MKQSTQLLLGLAGVVTSIALICVSIRDRNGLDEKLAHWIGDYDLVETNGDVMFVMRGTNKRRHEIIPEPEIRPYSGSASADYAAGVNAGLEIIALVNLEASLRQTNWNFGQMSEIVRHRILSNQPCWPFDSLTHPEKSKAPPARGSR